MGNGILHPRFERSKIEIILSEIRPSQEGFELSFFGLEVQRAIYCATGTQRTIFLSMRINLLKKANFNRENSCDDNLVALDFKYDFWRTATAGSDVVQSGRPIFDDFSQHLRPYIGNNTANGDTRTIGSPMDEEEIFKSGCDFEGPGSHQVCVLEYDHEIGSG
ncbi:UNVERIFIED_CONTAM: hypothetical protein NCL1_33990 [Trichonephila clavipes]